MSQVKPVVRVEMPKEKPIWKILTLIVALLGVFTTLFIHYDTKHSTEIKIVEALSERYANVDKDMTYEEALEAVDRDIKQLENEKSKLQLENADLNSTISLCQEEKAKLEEKVHFLEEEQNNEKERYEKIKLAQTYAELGKYETAIPILNSISAKTADVNALLKDYTTEYENTVLANVSMLASKGEYDEAEQLISDALMIVPSSNALTEKKNNITPHYLVDTIECFKATNLWLLSNRESLKMGGKSYQHAIYTQDSDPFASMISSAYNAAAYYNLESKYSQLSGIVGHIDFSGSGTLGENDGGRVYDAEVTIWGDDKKLASIPLRATDSTKTFNFSIEGVNTLEFSVKCSGNSKVGIAEIQIR